MPARPVAVVDIDGVVADVRHRLDHLRGRYPDWGGFFGGAADDPPLDVGLALVAELADGHDIVWLTGRPEWLRAVTAGWLAAAGLPAGELLMRPNRDRRPARDYKLSRIRRIAAAHRIAAIVDDDPDVVETLEAAGWPVLLADWVPYTSTLGHAQEGHGRT
jgi:hypothetical protein